MSDSSRQTTAKPRRRSRKKPNIPDCGPLQRWQHAGRMLHLTEYGNGLAARVSEEHVMDVLVMKGILTDTQCKAAFKLKRDFKNAGLDAHVTGSYSPVRTKIDWPSGAPERTDAQEAAYRRWRDAVREMGLRFSNVVLETACHDCMPSRADVLALQQGLDSLVRWYRLSRQETTAPRHQAIRAARAK